MDVDPHHLLLHQLFSSILSRRSSYVEQSLGVEHEGDVKDGVDGFLKNGNLTFKELNRLTKNDVS